MPDAYSLVHLRNGSQSVRALDVGETFHPVVGPAEEAQSLYVNQLRLPARLRDARGGELVVWDIGLGAAANALAMVRAARDTAGALRLVSFDRTDAALRFAIEHRAALGYFEGFEAAVASLLESRSASLDHGTVHVQWEFHLADFPSLIAASARHSIAPTLPAPHAILFDPHSPAVNPAMWTAPLFAAIHARLDPARPCALATYSRATLVRVALLLGGFFVGKGGIVAEKEETTVAANTPDLLAAPLDRRWLDRARRSDAAEPLHEAIYQRTPLTDATWEQLRAHPQFS